MSTPATRACRSQTRSGSPDSEAGRAGRRRHIQRAARGCASRPDLRWLCMRSPLTGRRAAAQSLLKLRCPLPANLAGYQVFTVLLEWVLQDEDSVLDLVDGALFTLEAYRRGDAAQELRALLRLGGSVWTVASNDQALVLAVEEAAQQSFDDATSPPDSLSNELSVAWSNAYGRTPDASDSWDHAIKAVEHVLIPLVAPNQSKPNLGHVVGSLDAQGQLWRWCCRATICLMRRRRSSQCFVSCGRTMTATAVGRRAFRRCRKRARWSRSPSRSCSGSHARRAAVGLARLARSVRSRPSLLDRV